jgi:hypothetical protein
LGNYFSGLDGHRYSISNKTFLPVELPANYLLLNGSIGERKPENGEIKILAIDGNDQNNLVAYNLKSDGIERDPILYPVPSYPQLDGY